MVSLCSFTGRIRLAKLAEFRKSDSAFLGDLEARRFRRDLDETRIEQLLGDRRRHLTRARFGSRAAEPEDVLEIELRSFLHARTAADAASEKARLCPAATFRACF